MSAFDNQTVIDLKESGAVPKIKEKHPNGSVARAEKVTQGGQIEYEAAVRSGGKSFDLVFDADGKLISSREVKVNIVLRSY